MKARGNSEVAQCVQNLMNIRRGEIFFDRRRGLPRSPIGKPLPQGRAELKYEIEWTLRTYEPRKGGD